MAKLPSSVLAQIADNRLELHRATRRGNAERQAYIAVVREHMEQYTHLPQDPVSLVTDFMGLSEDDVERVLILNIAIVDLNAAIRRNRLFATELEKIMAKAEHLYLRERIDHQFDYHYNPRQIDLKIRLCTAQYDLFIYERRQKIMERRYINWDGAPLLVGTDKEFESDSETSSCDTPLLSDTPSDHKRKWRRML